MKSIVPLMLIILSAFIFTSCKKNNVLPANTATPVIPADWNLASDSVTLASKLDLAYQGLTGDYYNFSADGKLYVNEGKYGRDTAEYTINSDTAITFTKAYNGVVLNWQGYANPWKVTISSGHKMTLTSGVAIPGAGWEQETITLSK